MRGVVIKTLPSDRFLRGRWVYLSLWGWKPFTYLCHSGWACLNLRWFVDNTLREIQRQIRMRLSIVLLVGAVLSLTGCMGIICPPDFVSDVCWGWR